MKKFLPFVLILLLAACGESVAHLNNQGNESFAESEYETALNTYRKAQVEGPDVPQPYYNAANNRESIHRIMSCFSEEEQKRLRSYLEKLRNAALKELGMEEPPFPPSE